MVSMGARGIRERINLGGRYSPNYKNEPGLDTECDEMAAGGPPV